MAKAKVLVQIAGNNYASRELDIEELAAADLDVNKTLGPDGFGGTELKDDKLSITKDEPQSQEVLGSVAFLADSVKFNKTVSNTVETAGATIQVSQRVAMKAFGNELVVASPVGEDSNLLLHVPFNTTDATDEIHVPRLGIKQLLSVQSLETDTFMGTQIIATPVIGLGDAVTSVIQYKFGIAGVPVRQRTMVTNLNNETFDVYGTSEDPYLYFTSEVGLTAIELPSPVPVTLGHTFESIIESVDGSPLNIIGVNGGPVFSPWLSVESQAFGSTPLVSSDIEGLQDELDNLDLTDSEIKTKYENNANTNAFTDTEKTLLGSQSGTNTGDQDLSGLALKSNVLELDNTTPFTPDAEHEPATKKYVDDNVAAVVKSSAYLVQEDNVASTILTLNQWKQINIDPTGFDLTDFTHAAGVLTYTGVPTKTFKFKAFLCQLGTGNDKQCEFAWFKNDTTQLMGKQNMDISMSKYYGTVVPTARVSLDTNEDMRVCMRNIEDGSNTTILHSTLEVVEE